MYDDRSGLERARLCARGSFAATLQGVAGAESFKVVRGAIIGTAQQSRVWENMTALICRKTLEPERQPGVPSSAFSHMAPKRATPSRGRARMSFFLAFISLRAGHAKSPARQRTSSPHLPARCSTHSPPRRHNNIDLDNTSPSRHHRPGLAVPRSPPAHPSQRAWVSDCTRPNYPRVI